jgi:hypothetical protein
VEEHGVRRRHAGVTAIKRLVKMTQTNLPALGIQHIIIVIKRAVGSTVITWIAPMPPLTRI